MQGQLDLGGIPGKLVRVTPARLVLWSSCPRKYRMTYLDKPTPVRAGAWAHSTLGAVVHNALRAFFELPSEKRTPERAMTLVSRYWSSDGFADAEQAARYREHARHWLSEYVSRLDPQTTPVAVERWVSATAGTIIAEGRVDRIDQRSGELVVVDYKTGQHGLKPEDARDSLALALYVLGTRKTLRQPCHRVELHHLPTGRVMGWDHTEESLGWHLGRAEQLAAKLQAATETWDSEMGKASPGKFGAEERAVFPPRPGRQCSSCEFRAHCSEGQQAAPEIPRWALLGE